MKKIIKKVTNKDSTFRKFLHCMFENLVKYNHDKVIFIIRDFITTFKNDARTAPFEKWKKQNNPSERYQNLLMSHGKFPTREAWAADILQYLTVDNPTDDSFYTYVTNQASLPSVFECVKSVLVRDIGTSTFSQDLIVKRILVPTKQITTLALRVHEFKRRADNYFQAQNYWMAQKKIFGVEKYLQNLLHETTEWSNPNTTQIFRTILQRQTLKDLKIDVSNISF